MTPDELRDRTRAALEVRTVEDEECPRCHGKGHVSLNRPVVTQAELAAIIGVQRTSVTTFLAGRQGLTLPATLKLLEWLEDPSRG